ncbi:hypothetical protein [Lysinibacillus sp. NPDC092081]
MKRWVTIRVDSSHNAHGIIWFLSISAYCLSVAKAKRQLQIGQGETVT